MARVIDPKQDPKHHPKLDDKHWVVSVNDLVKKQFSASKIGVMSKLVRRLFENVPDNELEARSIEELYGLADTFWSELNKSNKGGLRLRVFNPDIKKDGWTSTHTIIELINTDMPYLVDTLMMALNRLNLNVHFVIHTGRLRLIRSALGKVSDILYYDDIEHKKESHEALIYVEIDKQKDGSKQMQKIESEIKKVMKDVSLAVSDFLPMKARMKYAIEDLEMIKSLSKIPRKFIESISFLNWLLDNNFIFLGYNYFNIKHDKSNKKTRVKNKDALLGILKDQKNYPVDNCVFRPDSVTTYHGALDLSISVEKANYLSYVHRSAYMEVITILEYDKNFSVVGEHQFLGLFTSSAYHAAPLSIPFIRRKVTHILDRSKFLPGGHAYKALVNVLETFPRDELFQLDENLLFKMCKSIVHIGERRQVRLYLRKDHYNRYYTCMVYLPKDLYTSALSNKIEKILLRELGGCSVTSEPRFLESINCRIDVQVRLDLNNPLVKIDEKIIEDKIIKASRNWRDDFLVSLSEKYGESEASRYFNEYVDCFSVSYIEDFSPSEAADDIKLIEKKLNDKKTNNNGDGVELYFIHDRPEQNGVRLKVFHYGSSIPLSKALPILENFGLKVLEERPYSLITKDNHEVWLSDFIIDLQVRTKDFGSSEIIFKEAFNKAWRDYLGSDGFNMLVVSANLTWRETIILRAYTRYSAQTYFNYTETFIQQTVSQYPNILKMIVCLFDLKFNPAYFESELVKSFKSSDKEKMQQKVELSEHYKSLKDAINHALDGVIQLDHDRVLRRFLELIEATVRTNYYQHDKNGDLPHSLAFKVRPEMISNMPKPLPMFEVYVYSKRFEGVHLRGAKVSRGGLRWSNRQDFRTEILGLMKAQQVKNTVIVPMGAKGGFLPKRLDKMETRDEIQQEGIACYKEFIGSLLDLTDNRDKDYIIHPKDIVYYDSADPYLVVAADKGTATFSDIANQISIDRGFWLGDAFASGGSNGYDHKKMGITAKGAWESVKRHFLMMGRDIQKTEFTAVGIGDMSGDVFGNGMLLSKHLRLVAAFNHMHIFIDPNPDAKTSYQIRKQLFKMPRSSWSDYDPKAISKGGGVFSRSLKKIELTTQIKEALGIDESITELEPNNLIQAILKAPVDLLWNGGIGTYIKASTETDIDVDDKVNDALRVNASDLMVKVVGEGGNLGLTQSARIEFALNSGFIYTDAIDNAAGVNCSDHEVNIKILLNDVMRAGDLNQKQRNELLASMEKEVGILVLNNNYQQTQAIDNMLYQNKIVFHGYLRVIQHLEKLKILKRKTEFVASDKVLKARFKAGVGLTGPEISVILAYSKIVLKAELLKSDVPNKVYFKSYLYKPFPSVLVDKYKKYIDKHYLAKEIIVTQLLNEIVQYMGMGFVGRLIDATGATAEQVVCAFVIAKEIFDFDVIWDDIEKLDGKVDAKVQRKMMNMLSKLLRRVSRWFLRNSIGSLEIQNLINKFQPKVAVLSEELEGLLTKEDIRQRNVFLNDLLESKVPKKIALRVVNFNFKHSFMDIIKLSEDEKSDLCGCAKFYYKLSERLSFSWLQDAILHIPAQGYWEVIASSALRDDIDYLQRMLVVNAMGLNKNNKNNKKNNINNQIEKWSEKHRYVLMRWDSLIEDLKVVRSDFIMYSVAVRSLLDLAKSGLNN